MIVDSRAEMGRDKVLSTLAILDGEAMAAAMRQHAPAPTVYYHLHGLRQWSREWGSLPARQLVRDIRSASGGGGWPMFGHADALHLSGRPSSRSPSVLLCAHTGMA